MPKTAFFNDVALPQQAEGKRAISCPITENRYQYFMPDPKISSESGWNFRNSSPLRKTFRNESNKLQHEQASSDGGDLRRIIQRRAVTDDVSSDEVQSAKAMNHLQDSPETKAV